MKRPATLRTDRAAVSRLLDAAAAHMAAGALDEAAKLYRRAERADPADFGAPFSLATIDLARGRPAEAAARLAKVTRLQPQLFDAWHNLGAASQACGRNEAAAEAYLRALALRADAIETRRNLAIVLGIVGRLDEAEAQHRQLAAAPSTRLWALVRLAGLRAAAIDDTELEDMRRGAANLATHQDAKIGLWFAIAEVLERRGRHDEAFAAFAEGNRLKRTEFAAKPATDPRTLLGAHQEAARRVSATFSADFLARHDGLGLATTAPIFIVGMPRSGSTLIERILASHPDVTALGETAALPRLLERGFPGEGHTARPTEVRALARSYLEAVRARGWRGVGRFVDKTLENYLHVGAIAAMFPRAVVLHAVRDPIDTCLSCYRQNFATGAETLYDLAEIGAECVAYRQVMDHWCGILPGRVIDVDHEALVADPDDRIRWLVTEACGLAWNDSCLRFHETAGTVTTASASQVRRPIFHTSIERWRRYERHLAPLLEALGPYAP